MVAVVVVAVIYFNTLNNLLDRTEIMGNPTIEESDLADSEDRMPLPTESSELTAPPETQSTATSLSSLETDPSQSEAQPAQTTESTKPTQPTPSAQPSEPAQPTQPQRSGYIQHSAGRD